MQRNRTIIGLSDAVVCIESGMREGTFAAAETTFSLNLPLFVADYAQPAESAAGNRHFLQRGATPLRSNRDGQPNLERVYAAIGMAPSPESSRPEVDDSTIHAPEGSLPPHRVEETKATLRELGLDDDVQRGE